MLSKREQMQDEHLKALDAWLNREMTALEERSNSGQISLQQYAREVRRLDRTYAEDYADIFAG